MCSVQRPHVPDLFSTLLLCTSVSLPVWSSTYDHLFDYSYIIDVNPIFSPCVKSSFLISSFLRHIKSLQIFLVILLLNSHSFHNSVFLSLAFSHVTSLAASHKSVQGAECRNWGNERGLRRNFVFTSFCNVDNEPTQFCSPFLCKLSFKESRNTHHVEHNRAMTTMAAIISLLTANWSWRTIWNAMHSGTTFRLPMSCLVLSHTSTIVFRKTGKGRQWCELVLQQPVNSFFPFSPLQAHSGQQPTNCPAEGQSKCACWTLVLWYVILHMHWRLDHTWPERWCSCSFETSIGRSAGSSMTRYAPHIRLQLLPYLSHNFTPRHQAIFPFPSLAVQRRASPAIWFTARSYEPVPLPQHAEISSEVRYIIPRLDPRPGATTSGPRDQLRMALLWHLVWSPTSYVSANCATEMRDCSHHTSHCPKLVQQLPLSRLAEEEQAHELHAV